MPQSIGISLTSQAAVVFIKHHIACNTVQMSNINRTFGSSIAAMRYIVRYIWPQIRIALALLDIPN